MLSNARTNIPRPSGAPGSPCDKVRSNKRPSDDGNANKENISPLSNPKRTKATTSADPLQLKKKEDENLQIQIMAVRGFEPETIQRLAERAVQVKDLIDEGNYCSVYRARDTQTAVIHAVKVSKKHEDDVFWKLTYTEAQECIKLDHPHVIDICGFSADLNRIAIVMPCYRQTLGERLEGCRVMPFPPSECLQMCREIASGLVYIHSRELIHCDLKASNILLDDHGHLRIADLGFLSRPAARDVMNGECFYMAPELSGRTERACQRQEKAPFSYLSDIFGYGFLGYCIYAQKHFRACWQLIPIADNQQQLVSALHMPQLRRSQGAEREPAFQQTVLPALRFTPSERPQSMKEIEDRLQKITISCKT